MPRGFTMPAATLRLAQASTGTKQNTSTTPKPTSRLPAQRPTALLKLARLPRHGILLGGSRTQLQSRTERRLVTYDSMGNVLTKTITDTTATPTVSRTWTYTYDTYGRMLTAKGPRTDVNNTTTYTYYTCTTGSQCGQLQTVTDPVGNVTTYNTYNAHGQPLTITDPNGVVTTLTYDNRERLTSRQVGTETTSFSYYPTGLLEQVDAARQQLRSLHLRYRAPINEDQRWCGSFQSNTHSMQWAIARQQKPTIPRAFFISRILGSITRSTSSIRM